MELTFTKRSGKYDELVIVRGGQRDETIACPKQGIIPHDMVHYAVESTLAHRGFLSLVREGQAAGFATTGNAGEEAIERLVETFQAEMWGGRVAASDLIAIYEHACEARGNPVAPVSADDIAVIRSRIDTLTAQWAAVPENGALSLRF